MPYPVSITLHRGLHYPSRPQWAWQRLLLARKLEDQLRLALIATRCTIIRRQFGALGEARSGWSIRRLFDPVDRLVVPDRCFLTRALHRDERVNDRRPWCSLRLKASMTADRQVLEAVTGVWPRIIPPSTSSCPALSIRPRPEHASGMCILARPRVVDL